MRYLIAFLISAVLYIPMVAQAQTLCGDRKSVVKSLEKRYSEEPVSRGLATNGAVIEVLTSEETQTFTIIFTRPNGLSCVMAAGENWEIDIRKLKGKKEVFNNRAWRKSRPFFYSF